MGGDDVLRQVFRASAKEVVCGDKRSGGGSQVVIGRVQGRSTRAGALQPKKARLTRTRAARGMRCERADSGLQRNVVAAAAVKEKESTFTRAGTSWVAVSMYNQGPSTRRALFRPKDEITPHVGPCFRCLHTRTLAHPVRVAAGYSASPRRYRLCAAHPAGGSLPRLREQCAAVHHVHRARNAWSAQAARTRNAALCAVAGSVYRPVSLDSRVLLRVHNLYEPSRPSTFACREQGPLRLLDLRQFPSHSATVDPSAGQLQSVPRTVQGT